MERQATEIEATNMLMLGKPAVVEPAVVPATSITSTRVNYPAIPKTYSQTLRKDPETDFDDPPF